MARVVWGMRVEIPCAVDVHGDSLADFPHRILIQSQPFEDGLSETGTDTSVVDCDRRVELADVVQKTRELESVSVQTLRFSDSAADVGDAQRMLVSIEQFRLVAPSAEEMIFEGAVGGFEVGRVHVKSIGLGA